VKNTHDIQARWLALLAAAAVAIYLCWLMLKPFVAVLAWASVLVVIFYPAHKRLSRVIKRPGRCAAVSSFLVIAAILIPFSLIASAVIRELSGMADYLQTNLSELVGPNSSVISRALGWFENHTGIGEIRLQQFLVETLKATSGSLASQTLGLVGGAIGAILQGFSVIATMYYLFRDGDQILAGVRQFVPLEDSQSEAIICARSRSDWSKCLRSDYDCHNTGNTGRFGLLVSGTSFGIALGSADDPAFDDSYYGLMVGLNSRGGLSRCYGSLGKGYFTGYMGGASGRHHR
jgi:predicted PurR-regulated permease PerM